jgi:DNA-binding NtrC family response regulator
VLQERVVTPVGSHDGAPVDVRVIAASNRDLQIEVSAGRFREDLYFRLNVVSIETRALHERGDDVELLAVHILKRLAAENGMPLKHLSDTARRQLQTYDWPGNIRELENAIERAILFSPSGTVQTIGVHKTEDGHWPTAAEVEKEHIVRTLDFAAHNQSAAARLLDIDRHQLRRRMQEYDLMQPGQARRGRPSSSSALPRKKAA